MRQVHLDPLTRRVVAEAIPAFVADLLTVLKHVLADEDGDYGTTGGRQTITKVALRAVPSRDAAQWDMEAIGKVLSWCLFVCAWNAQQRQLSCEEQAVRDAAMRLSDAFHVARAHLQGDHTCPTN